MNRLLFPLRRWRVRERESAGLQAAGPTVPPIAVRSASVRPAAVPRRACLGLVGLFASAILVNGSAHAAGVVTSSALTNLYAALLGGGRVTFNLSAAATYNLQAPLQIQTDTILDASASAYAVTFAGGNNVRLFNVSPGVRLELLKVSLVNGLSTNGGAVYNDHGTLIATDCTFNNHHATGAAGVAGTAGRDDYNIGHTGGTGGTGGAGTGGAIWSSGDVQLTRCTFDSNQAQGGDGGDGGTGGTGAIQAGDGGDAGPPGAGFGGALYCTGQLALDACTFQANSATGGGGGSGGSGGPGSSFFSPTSGRSSGGGASAGGAVYSLGSAVVADCTFVTNTVTGGAAVKEFANATGMGRDGHSGGATYGGAFFNGGTAQFVNSTFSANAVTGGAGGAGGDSSKFFGGRGGDGGAALGGSLWNQGQVAVTNCTFAAGYAAGGAGGAAGASGDSIDPGSPRPGATGQTGGGNVATGSGSFVLLNCIVANAAAGGNGFGALTDAGHNLSSDTTCAFTGPDSLNQTDPLLGTLGNYGGTTQTIPLLAGSPAIDAGASVTGLVQDQRGNSRPQGLAYDLGAFERSFAGLSGQVTRADGRPFPGVTISLLSATSLPATTTTDTDGRFEFVQLPDVDLGTYRVAPVADGSTFNPAFRDIQLSSASQVITNLDFVALGERITGFGFTTNGMFQVRFLGAPGQGYRLQSTATLTQWQETASGTTDTNGLIDFIDPIASSTTGQRFYRVVTP